MNTVRSILTTVILAAGILFAFVIWVSSSSESHSTAAASQPLVQPGSAMKKSMAPASETTTPMEDAVRNAPDVSFRAIGNGTVMFATPYGPCGILYKRNTEFLWHEDPGTDQFFPDMSSAIITATSQCEAFFIEEKSARDAASAFETQAPIESPQATPTN